MHEKLGNLLDEARIKWRTRNYPGGKTKSEARRVYGEIHRLRKVPHSPEVEERLKQLNQELMIMVSNGLIEIFRSKEEAERWTANNSDTLQDNFQETGNVNKRDLGVFYGRLAVILRTRAREKKND